MNHFFSAFRSITQAQLLLQGRWTKKSPAAAERAAELESRAKECFARCDLNSDGRITLEEFLSAGGPVAEQFELVDDDEEEEDDSKKK